MAEAMRSISVTQFHLMLHRLIVFTALGSLTEAFGDLIMSSRGSVAQIA